MSKLILPGQRNRKWEEMQKVREKLMSQIMDNRNKILEDFTKAYLAETKLMPSEVQLVEVHEETRVVFKFERIKKDKEEIEKCGP
jgi:hypothetical protein